MTEATLVVSLRMLIFLIFLFFASSSAVMASMIRRPNVDLDTGPQYNDTLGRKFLDLAAASWLSDSPGDEAKRQKCYDQSWSEYGFKTLFVQDVACDANGNQCRMFMSYSKSTNTYALSYRGTVGLNQLATEFSASLNPYIEFTQGNLTMGKVNQYWYNAASRLMTSIIKNIQNADTQANFIITGHSLGAAMASITAAMLSIPGIAAKENIRLLTFGQPRCWDDASAKYFPNWVPHAWRVVHNTDPVPHAPPMSSNVNPYHHPQEIWYDEPSVSYLVCDANNGEDPTCSDGVNDSFFKWDADNLQQEHMTYMGLLLNRYADSGCTAPPPTTTTTLVPTTSFSHHARIHYLWMICAVHLLRIGLLA